MDREESRTLFHSLRPCKMTFKTQFSGKAEEIQHFDSKTENDSKTYRLGEENISSTQLMSYAASFNYFAPSSKIIFTYSHEHQLKSEGLHQYRFKKLLIAALGLLFIILLGKAGP